MAVGKNKENRGNKPFLSIIGGNIKQPSSEGVEGAVKREWESKDGTTGVKWELTHDFVEGNIVGLNYKDGDYGSSLIVDLQEGNDVYSLQISTKSRYYDDFAKKVKALDLTKRVKISPYDFESKTDKDKKGNPKKIVGVSVYQEGEKIMSHYYDGKKTTNGMPEVDKKEQKELGDAYWTVYFAKVGAFLKREIEGVEIPEFTPKAEEVAKQETVEDDALNEDLPF